jgi:hypothetical protein
MGKDFTNIFGYIRKATEGGLCTELHQTDTDVQEQIDQAFTLKLHPILIGFMRKWDRKAHLCTEISRNHALVTDAY